MRPDLSYVTPFPSTLRVLINKLKYVHFEYNSGFTVSKLSHHLSKIHVFFTFLKNFALLVCQTYDFF